jgi:DNA processing protein
MEDQALYQLALAHIDGIGPVYTKKLIRHFGDATTVFQADQAALEPTGLPHSAITAILEFSGYPALRDELRRLDRIGARILFFTDPDYPRRLLKLPNAPALLFYQGNATLNADKVIAIAGTRGPSEYGKEMTARLIRELARPELLILSGLAFGIDAVAHRAAMKCQLPTVGVLGHGLDHLYPAQHLTLSYDMRRNGGLLTSFLPEIGPGSHTFPVRNQLVAGLCDALIVIESSAEGGSLSAAKAAYAFNKKVFALPGRINDHKSQGCLQLICKGEALPLLSADQLIATMGWGHPAGQDSYQPALPFSPTEPAESQDHEPARQQPQQPQRPPQPPQPQQPQHPRHPHLPVNQKPTHPPSRQLRHPKVHQPNQPKLPQPQPNPQPVNALEARLINLLTGKPFLTFEDFIALTRLPIPKICLTLLNLEIKGIIRALPGRRYLLAS